MHAQTPPTPKPGISSLLWSLRRPVLLVASDLVAVLGTALFVGLVRALFFPEEALLHLSLFPVLLVALFFYYIEGLYDSVLPPFPQELRKLGVGLTLAYLALGLLLFMGRSELPSRLVFGLSWVLSLGVTPWLRVQVRRRFAGELWWGRPVVILGAPDRVAALIRYLRFHPETGLRPAAVVCSSAPGELAESAEQGELAGLAESDAFIMATMQVLGTDDLPVFAAAHPNAYAVIMSGAWAQSEVRELMELAGRLFPSVYLMVGYKDNEIPMWLRPVEIADTMALQVRQNLFDPRRLALKRGIDFMLALIGGLILLPFLIGIAIWIRLESPGSPLFTQRRVGMHGKHFSVLKFRTMVRDAEAVLASHLAANPDLRAEWEANQKLRNDPRITRMGHFLRRTSLDELPQLWNVLLGDMSLVGPRPIVDAEIEKYGSAFAAYTRVRPGMTGLWQVSGRNDTTYAYRVHIDSYYICNWSLWMDVWILARTPLVVLRCAGAY